MQCHLPVFLGIIRPMLFDSLQIMVFRDTCLWLPVTSMSLCRWTHKLVTHTPDLVWGQHTDIARKRDVQHVCWAIGSSHTSCLWYWQPSRDLKIERPWPRLNMKTIFSRYGDFHVKDKTVARPSYFWHGIPILTTSLYWDGSQAAFIIVICVRWRQDGNVITYHHILTHPLISFLL